MNAIIYYTAVILVPFNGITNALFGEIVSEAIILGIAGFYFLRSRRMRTKNIIFILVLFYVILENFVYLLIIEEPIRILFVFPYAFLILLLLSEKIIY